MKKLFTLLCAAFPFAASAQIPLGYYNTTSGLTGQSLRVALRNIIRPHTTLAYSDLWTAYYYTDAKSSGKLWDMYSDIPGGTPAYEYTLGTGQCGGGTIAAEGDCYNREHSWPQSKFGSAAPMQTDLFLVIPTDGWVNAQRSDLPYGVAGAPFVDTFTNGSLIGDNAYAGSPTGNCFEPIDSFKGDIARGYFYITTCYWADSSAFSSWEMATRVNLKPWAIQMLMEWHHADPVSQKEIDRNNQVYLRQNNRNPFIDHPGYADCIWGTGPCVTEVEQVTAKDNGIIPRYDNYANLLNIDWSVTGSSASLSVVDINGRILYHQSLAVASHGTSTINTATWSRGMYFIRLTGASSSAAAKVVIY